MAFWAVLLYSTVSVVWILASGWVLACYISDPAQIVGLQTLRTMVFLAVSSLFFFFFLRDMFRSYEGEVAERKKLQAEVALHEQRLNAFFTSAPAGLVLLDTELRYVQVNDTVAEVNGLSIQAHIGKTLREILPKLAPVAEPLLRKVLDTGQPVLNVELSGETPAQPGVLRHWMESFFPILGKDGKPDGIGAIFVEITGRKLAEEKSRESETHLRNIIDSMFAFVGLLSLDGVMLEVNRAPLEAAGIHREDVLGKPMTESYWWSYSPKAQERLREALRRAGQGEVVRGDYEIRLAKGNLICIDATFSPLHDAAGRITGVIGSAVDITARKIAEQELLWKTAFLEAQVDSSLDGILVVDSQGRKILQNQRTNDLWHFPPDIAEHSDDNVRVQFVAQQTKDPSAFTSKVAYLYAHPDEISRDEIELVNGTILDRYSSPVRDKAGKHYGRIWTFRDITDQRKLEEQYRQAQKMEAIGQLAGGVAHDFNNILAVIQLQAGLLKDDRSLSPAQLDFATGIEEAAQRAADLTRQLLLFSRKQALQPRNLSLNDVVNDTARMLQRILGEQIQMQLNLSPQPLFIYADAGMIDQILLNLAVNARDAMPGGGQLVIETSSAEFDEAAASHIFQCRPGSYACVTVIDTGKGIPPEVLPRIFDPFFTTKEVGKGTGLGLATVFGIVQQHQGWINVDSKPGSGTTFRIYLPRMAAASIGKSARISLPSIRGGDETILLVEDDVSLRVSVRIALMHLGYRVLEASTGTEALEIWEQHCGEIRLLLTDLVMPGEITGRQLALKLLHDNPRLKIIYSSGYSAELACGDFKLKEGANFLAKPFEAHKLAQTVRTLLDQED